jgi:hypothetical protein
MRFAEGIRVKLPKWYRRKEPKVHRFALLTFFSIHYILSLYTVNQVIKIMLELLSYSTNSAQLNCSILVDRQDLTETEKKSSQAAHAAITVNWPL